MYFVTWYESEKSGRGFINGGLRSRSFDSAEDAGRFAANLKSNVWCDVSMMSIEKR